MRNVDLSKYDVYQKYYHSWYRRFPGVGFLSFLRQSHLKKKEIQLVRRACAISDMVFTDSNSSMQLILRYANPKFIKYYHPFSIIDVDEKTVLNHFDEKYALMININRNEKNFLRTLDAYLKYIETSNSDLKLYAVGLTDTLMKNIRILFHNKIGLIEKHVRFFEYIDSKLLFDLYQQCSFVLYTSKSEGYGLPMLDACEASKPVVAGRKTSIPEIIGASCYYIDPYSLESIKEGIAFMDDDKNNAYYSDLIKSRKSLVHMRQELDSSILVRDIIS